MGKNKIRRFQENDTFNCLVKPPFDDIFHKEHPLKGNWCQSFFKKEQSLILELGCGRGEYTVALSALYPDRNFIGIDIKGARIWRGAKTVTEKNILNAGFLRTRIEFIEAFFGENEVDEIWITFPDPQLKKTRVKKRLSGSMFLTRYARFLGPGGVINLKTDSLHLHAYTKALIAENNLTTLVSCTDIYHPDNKGSLPPEAVSIQTNYESKYLSENKPITFLKFRLDNQKEFREPYFEPDENL